jgi:hypothetical protein
VRKPFERSATLSRAVLLLSLISAQAATAGTLTNISFISSNRGFFNDTIVNGFSPLAFTLTGGTNNPFLNAVDSTVSLGYGNYFAIAFLGFGQHLGSGTVSFVLDGTTTFTQNVIFPANSPGGVLFASFSLPGGDSVTISTTGLSADRIQVFADGAGLAPDGTNDAFYLFSYTQAASSAVPEPSSVVLFGGGLAGLAAVVRRRNWRKN